MTAVFTLRAALAWFFSVPVHAPAVIGAWACSMAAVLFPPLFSRALADLYYPMLSHLASGARARFPAWFSERLEQTFGRAVSAPSLMARASHWIRINRGIAFGSAAIWLTSGGLTSLLIPMAGTPAERLLARFDIQVVGLVSSYPTWVGVTAFRFLLQYAKLPLRPLLGAAGEVSLSGIQARLLPARALTALYMWGAFLFVLVDVPDGTTIDLVTFGLAYPIITGSWLLGIPLALWVALRKARSTVAMEYSRHLDSAFQAFVNEPDPRTLERYEWLSQKQRVVSGLSTRPMSWGNALTTLVFLALYWGACWGYVWVKMSGNRMPLLHLLGG